MLPYDAILFDVGGVLLNNGWDHLERAAAVAAFHLDNDEFERRHAELDDTWERGKITMADYLSYTVFHQPRSFSLEDFTAFVFDQSHLLPNGAIHILAEFAASGNYLLGALNNEARETNEYRFSHFGLHDYFDLALSSCYIGLRKPEPAIYRCAIDIVGRKPERILFIDDREGNTDAAKAIGMCAILFKGDADLRRELAQLGAL
jgi:putative hydrolase of the HAD superfamily